MPYHKLYHPHHDQTVKRLSRREYEVLKLLVSGLSVKEIAVKLNLAVGTAETHRANINKKLLVHNRHELIKSAVLTQNIPCPFCVAKPEDSGKR